MTPSFVGPRAHFLKNNQIAPNSLIFNTSLSDSAIRLLLALNGLPENGWVIVQSDIMHRLSWNPKKMTKVIKECVKAGFMRVCQNRSSQGTFCKNSFEFNVVPEFIQEQSTAHPKPSGGLPRAVIDHVLLLNESSVTVEEVCLCAPPVGGDTALNPRKQASPETAVLELQDFIDHCKTLPDKWSRGEIDTAWEIYKTAEKKIDHPLRYLEGILKNQRKLGIFKKNTGEKKCKTESLSKPSPISNDQIMDRVTLAQPYLGWGFQGGPVKKLQPG